MRKGILRILLTVFMLVGLIPMSALATEGELQPVNIVEYPVWVGGVQITSVNKDKITDAINAVTPDAATGSAKLTVDEDEYGNPILVLTLENFEYEGVGVAKGIGETTFEAAIFSEDPLTIKLVGDNIVTLKNSLYEENSEYFWGHIRCGIFAAGGMVIENADDSTTGSLTATGGKGSSQSAGIYACRDIIVNSGTITATGLESGYASGGILVDYAGITINGGEVNAFAGTITHEYGYVLGIGTYEEVEINGGTVTATSSSAAFFGMPTLNDDFTVYAGTTVNDADVADPIAYDTYYKPYVRIEPFIKYPVWVGDEQFTSANLVIDSTDDANITNGTATLTVGGTDAAPVYTLTLTGFTYNDVRTTEDQDHAAILSKVPIDIVVNGKNTITSTGGMATIAGLNGLTISGKNKESDKLIINSSADAGIFNADSLLKIKNVDVSVTSCDDSCAVAICSIFGIDTDNSNITVKTKTDVTSQNSLGAILGGVKINFKDSTVTVNWNAYALVIENIELCSAAIACSGNLNIENSVVIANCTDTKGSYGIAHEALPAGSGMVGGEIEYPISIKNSTVIASGTTAAYNCPVSNINGSLDNLVVYAGDSAANANEQAKDKEATYEGNKYVKITPKPVVTPTEKPTTKPTTKPKEENKQETPTLVETVVAPTVTPTTESEIQPAKKPETTVEEKEPEVEAIGEVVVKEKEGLLDFGGVLVQTAEELTEILVSEEDRALLEEGKDIIIFLENTDISEFVAEEDKQLVIEAVNSIENAQVGVYLDINLFKQIGDSDPEKITNTNEPIVVSVEIPQQLISNDENVQRTYYIVRVHNGQVDIIEGEFDAETGLFTFETDKFSTYTIVYTDVVTEEAAPAPEIVTQQSSFPWWIVFVGVAVVAVITGYVIYKKKREE